MGCAIDGSLFGLGVQGCDGGWDVVSGQGTDGRNEKEGAAGWTWGPKEAQGNLLAKSLKKKGTLARRAAGATQASKSRSSAGRGRGWKCGALWAELRHLHEERARCGAQSVHFQAVLAWPFWKVQGERREWGEWSQEACAASGSDPNKTTHVLFPERTNHTF